MSTEPDIMGRPAQPLTVDQLAADPAPKPARLYHWAYTLPRSVMDSAHWEGSDADLHFGVIEPTITQLQELGRDPSKQARDIAVGYVRALGQLGADGQVVVDDHKDPELRAVGYLEVERWFARIGPKAVQMVVGEWQALFNPSAAEGESMRASRRRG